MGRGERLTLHPEKTRIANCRKKGNGFEFLGYRFERGRRHVRKKSLDKLKDAIREKTRRSQGASLKAVIGHLNRTLRGWFGYFKHAHPSIFVELDGLIRRRLRALLRKQQKRPGRGVTLADHMRWPNAFFANAGAVRASHGLASSETVSMKKPPTGEPYAGKPPVRFGGRGRRKPIPTPIPRCCWSAEPMDESSDVQD